jgi:hypothetical protein
MTGPCEWNPMPHVLDVNCPKCRGPAVFEFAEVVRITSSNYYLNRPARLAITITNSCGSMGFVA